MLRLPITSRADVPNRGELLGTLLCLMAPSLAGAREGVVRLDLGCPGSAVQPGWMAWNVGSAGDWEGHGPFTFRVERALFDRDGFTEIQKTKLRAIAQTDAELPITISIV